MNIVFAADGGYTQHLAVAMASLLENNSGMDVYVVNSDISGAEFKKLEMLFSGKDSNIINARIDDYKVRSLVTRFHFTKATYYTLLIPDVIKVDKALYLDTDIVVTQDIKAMYATNISNAFLAAVINPRVYKNFELEMKDKAKYFNAGVMLINMESWRLYNVSEKVIEFIYRKPEVIQFADQDGLNSVINGNWVELHPKYNLQTALLNEEFAADSTIKEAIDSPVDIHYTGSSKPWHLGNTHPCKHLYWKYLRRTPYKYSLPSKKVNYLGAIFIKIVPKPIKELIKIMIKRIV